MLHFGERIKFLRKKNGLSQEELASALRDNYHLGTDRAMISKWETNFQSPAAETLADIADFFGVTMDSFVSNSAADDAGRLMREYVAGEDLPCGSVPGYSRAPEGMSVDFCVTVCDDTLASQGFLCGDKIYGVVQKQLSDGDRAVLSVRGKIEIRTVYIDKGAMVFVGADSACRPITTKKNLMGVDIIGKPTMLCREFQV